MQAAGTLRGTRPIYLLLVLLVPLIGCAYSVPLQYLPSIPGYIPVYIRHGDEPLEDINPDLAEAFGESSNTAKNLQLDRTLAHVSDNFKDNDLDALLEEESRSEHVSRLRVRAAESRSFATVDNDGNKNPNKPKLLTIYELPDDNERTNERRRRRYRGRSRKRNENWRAPSSKVSPLSDEEQKKPKELAIEKEEIQPNEISVPSRKRPRLPPEARRNRHKGCDNFTAPVKVQNPLDESSANLPYISQITDLPKASDGHRNVTASKAGKGEPPVKLQHPEAVLSNVHKISPIDLPNENEDKKDDKTKDSTKEPNDEIKLQRPETVLSNVHKISPIDLPNENEDDKTKDSTKEPNDEIAMD